MRAIASNLKRAPACVMAMLWVIASAAEEHTELALEEVTVSARKRTEDAQDVPIPLSLFTAQEIRGAGASDLTSLSAAIPNAQLETVGLFPNAAAFAMRGIGTTGIESYQDPRVALYIDGAYQTRVAAGPGELFDVASVEVLRGPQNVLYGRNALVGAINIHTRRPDGNLSSNAEVVVGNYGRRELQAGINLPLPILGLDIRLAYLSREWDGYARIGDPSQSFAASSMSGRDLSSVINQPVGGDAKHLYRLNLRARPTNNIDANLILTYKDERGSGSAPINQHLPGSIFGAFGFPGRDPFGDYHQGIAGDGSDPFISGASYGNVADIEDLDVLADLRAEVLGGKWTMVVDHRRQHSLLITDTDGELADLFVSTRLERFEQFQVETHFERPLFNDAARVLTGLFYLRDRYDVFQRLQLGFGAPGNAALDPPLDAVPALQFASDGRSRANQMQRDGQERSAASAYVDAQWRLRPGLNWNTSLRYTHEQRDAFNYPLQTPQGPAGSPALSNDFDVLKDQLRLGISCGRQVAKFHSLAPATGIDYRWSPQVLTYINWQRAFKSGGINVNGTCNGFHQPFADEHVDNYEIGLKSDWLQQRLQINLSAFHARYADLQQSVIRVNPNNPAAAETFIGNAAGARIQGIEATVTAQLHPQWKLTTNLGWLRARYTRFCANLQGIVQFTNEVPQSDCGEVTVLRMPGALPGQALVERDYKSLSLPFAPRWTLASTVRHQRVIHHWGEFSIEAGINYQAALQTQVLNQPFTDRRPLTTWNAGAGWSDATQRFSVHLWARNLNNAIARRSAVVVQPLFTFTSPTPPRTLGATLAVDF